jgi:hypothetical protein
VKGCSRKYISFHINGAHEQDRTADPFLTMEVLYQLSYAGPRKSGAGNGSRTRDPQLGRLMLYQLSYSRSVYENIFGVNEFMVEGVGFEPT